MSTFEERQKKMKAMLATLAVNVVVFLVLFFAAAWKTAGSGEGEFPGIEVNLGYDDYGTGDIQPQDPTGDPLATDDENSPEQKVTEEVREGVASSVPESTAPDTKVDPSNTVTDPNSDVEIKEQNKESKPVEKPVEKKPEEKIEKPVEQKIEQPVIDQKAVYKGKTGATTATTGEGDGKQGTPGSEGDDTGKTGDKGVEGGVEGAAIYKGKPGGGDGGTLELNGWDWDYIPKPSLKNETGRIVFKIKVDENGDLISVEKESGSLSAAGEAECRAAIAKLSFTKKPNAKVPQVSVGRITFVARAQ